MNCSTSKCFPSKGHQKASETWKNCRRKHDNACSEKALPILPSQHRIQDCEFVAWLKFHIRTVKYTIYIICTAFTHFLTAKPSMRGRPHQCWRLVAICMTSFVNSRKKNDSGVHIAAWFLNHGFMLFCLLFGHWTSTDVPLAGTQIDFITFSDQIMMIQIMNNEHKSSITFWKSLDGKLKSQFHWPNHYYK